MEALEERIERFLAVSYGSGDGSGDGDGDGDGYGYGISTFNHRKVYMVDGVQTLIDNVRGDVAQGAILRDDLTLQPCYIVKENDLFAHGDTLHDAMKSLQGKLMQELPTNERIKRFLAEHNTTDKYPALDLFEWHHYLTGSCRIGRENFCHNKGIDLDNDEYTVKEFVDMTINAYGSEMIKALKEEIEHK